MLKHNVTKGHDEPDDEKMSSFLQLKYHSKQDAKAKWGVVKTIRNTFIDNQRYLYHQFMPFCIRHEGVSIFAHAKRIYEKSVERKRRQHDVGNQ